MRNCDDKIIFIVFSLSLVFQEIDGVDGKIVAIHMIYYNTSFVMCILYNTIDLKQKVR